jgi:hypothetical protein
VSATSVSGIMEPRREDLELELSLTVSTVGTIKVMLTLEVKMETFITSLTGALQRRFLLIRDSSALSDMLKDNYSQELLTELKSGLLKEFLECLPQEMTLAINKLELLITVTVK